MSCSIGRSEEITGEYESKALLRRKLCRLLSALRIPAQCLHGCTAGVIFFPYTHTHTTIIIGIIPANPLNQPLNSLFSALAWLAQHIQDRRMQLPPYLSYIIYSSHVALYIRALWLGLPLDGGRRDHPQSRYLPCHSGEMNEK